MVGRWLFCGIFRRRRICWWADCWIGWRSPINKSAAGTNDDQDFPQKDFPKKDFPGGKSKCGAAFTGDEKWLPWKVCSHGNTLCVRAKIYPHEPVTPLSFHISLRKVVTEGIKYVFTFWELQKYFPLHFLLLLLRKRKCISTILHHPPPSCLSLRFSEMGSSPQKQSGIRLLQKSTVLCESFVAESENQLSLKLPVFEIPYRGGLLLKASPELIRVVAQKSSPTITAGSNNEAKGKIIWRFWGEPLFEMKMFVLKRTLDPLQPFPGWRFANLGFGRAMLLPPPTLPMLLTPVLNSSVANNIISSPSSTTWD